jgi:hypothetical protein
MDHLFDISWCTSVGCSELPTHVFRKVQNPVRRLLVLYFVEGQDRCNKVSDSFRRPKERRRSEYKNAAG